MRVGVDLGGTKIEALALDGDRIAGKKRVATPRDDYDATVEAIGRLVEEVEREAGVARATVGMGTPGAVSPVTGRMKNGNSTWLNGRALKEDVERRLGREIRVANDANCFALSEATDGAAAGAEIVFGVILGTGVGGGIVVRGREVRGANAIAGEWGHNPLPWPKRDERPGPHCWCGQTGCTELFLSGPGLARDAGVADPRDADDAAWARYEDRLARALAAVINVLDPDVIVLGGGLSNVERLYRNVPRLLPPQVFSDHVATRIVPPKFGDASGARGAARLWP